MTEKNFDVKFEVMCKKCRSTDVDVFIDSEWGAYFLAARCNKCNITEQIDYDTK